MSMSIDKAIEILESRKAPETEQDFDDFDSALETAINLLQIYRDSQRNDPMTLEQLREMDGEPVWIEFADGYKYYNGWALVQVYAKSTNVIYLIRDNGSVLHPKVEIDCGTKIYRRKPEEVKPLADKTAYPPWAEHLTARFERRE